MRGRLGERREEGRDETEGRRNWRREGILAYGDGGRER